MSVKYAIGRDYGTSSVCALIVNVANRCTPNDQSLVPLLFCGWKFPA
jgi:ribulose kinase